MRVNDSTELTPTDRRVTAGWLMIGLAVFLAIFGSVMWQRASSDAESDSLSAEMGCAVRGELFCDSDVEPDREVPYVLFAVAALTFLGGVIVASSARSGGDTPAPARSSLVAELDGIDAMLAAGRLTAEEHAAARRKLLGSD